MTGLRQAIGLLTRVPVGDVDGVDRAAAWFPLVGAGVGLVVAGVYGASYSWVPSLLAAVAAVTVGVWLTGAFHEDGLADTFDAFGSGAVGDEALRIMRDSRLGTYGTVALVVSLLARIVAVGSLSPSMALAGLVTSHALGRTNAVALMAVAPSARSDGLGSSGVAGVSPAGAWWAVGSGIVICLVAVGWWLGPTLILAAVTLVLIRRSAMKRIGGVTGDILGACEQITEILALVVIAAAAWRGWAPWWTS